MAAQGHRARTAGIDVVTYPTHVRDVVVVLGALPAGDAMAGAGNAAVPTLSGMMLDRGTATLDKFAIAERLEDVGASISFGVGTQSLEIHAKCLRKDLPMVLSILAAELRTPAFPAAELAKAKQQLIGSLRESLQNTGARAQEAFSRAVFPPGHPNRPHSVEDMLGAAQSATLDEIKSFHAKYVGPKHLTLIFVGDVGDAAVRREVAKDFAGWTGGEDYLRSTAPGSAAREVPPHDIEVPLKDKPSTTIVLGQADGMRYRDPDALPLRVGTAILGQGFTGRLMGTIRDREGLTYGIGAGVSADSIADGAWSISATFAPTLLEHGIASTRRVLEAWWKEGVTDDELAARKQGLIGGYFVGLSTTGGLASTILTTIQRGYDLSWLDGYPEAVRGVARGHQPRDPHPSRPLGHGVGRGRQHRRAGQRQRGAVTAAMRCAAGEVRPARCGRRGAAVAARRATRLSCLRRAAAARSAGCRRGGSNRAPSACRCAAAPRTRGSCRPRRAQPRAPSWRRRDRARRYRRFPCR
jgi:zinc protease